MKDAEVVGMMNREPEMTIEEMMVAMRDSLSNLASFDDGQDGEDMVDPETEQGKLSKDDEPGCVMGTIAKIVLQCTERFPQKEMKLDKSTKPGLEDAVKYFGERDTKYGMSELSVPAVVQPQMDNDTASPAPTIF
jgi:hypothetical protein